MNRNITIINYIMDSKWVYLDGKPNDGLEIIQNPNGYYIDLMDRNYKIIYFKTRNHEN